MFWVFTDSAALNAGAGAGFLNWGGGGGNLDLHAKGGGSSFGSNVKRPTWWAYPLDPHLTREVLTNKYDRRLVRQ